MAKLVGSGCTVRKFQPVAAGPVGGKQFGAWRLHGSAGAESDGAADDGEQRSFTQYKPTHSAMIPAEHSSSPISPARRSRLSRTNSPTSRRADIN